MQDKHTRNTRLKERVATALQLCYHDIGTLPTATKYDAWRKTLDPETKLDTPSLTAVVPLAFPTWQAAREAAGIQPPTTGPISHGPKPVWTVEQCIDSVRVWLNDPTAKKTFAGYNTWVDEHRAAGDRIPSVSTVRLRLRKPWSEIVLEAGAEQ